MKLVYEFCLYDELNPYNKFEYEVDDDDAIRAFLENECYEEDVECVFYFIASNRAVYEAILGLDCVRETAANYFQDCAWREYIKDIKE